MELRKNIKFKIGTPSNEEMSWEDAKKYAEEQGMRLPTRIESLIMVENRDKLGFELPTWWWTCEESSTTNAWGVSSLGGVLGDAKYGENGAVPVADFDSNLNSNSSQSESGALTPEQMVSKLRKAGYDVKCTKTIKL